MQGHGKYAHQRDNGATLPDNKDIFIPDETATKDKRIDKAACLSASYDEFFVAHSRDGHRFTLEKKPVFVSKKPLRFYDPRITRIGNTYYILFGVDHPEGEVTVGMAATKDFKKVEYCGEISPPDVRNAVLFPEKIGGLYVRLDRPFPLYYHWGWPAVVFACGVIPEKNGELKIYYGGADSCVCLATTTIDELVSLCLART